MINFRWLLAATLTFCGFLTLPAANVSTRAAYAGAIVLDGATGQVLFEDNAGVQRPPASMTKLMTFAVLHDKIASGALKLDTVVTVIGADSNIGGTQVWLKEKETFPVEELIYAMMIQSANDAAHALARVSAGSVPAFVEAMNAKAASLGMKNTVFRTPHGLPPSNRRVAEGDLTTPHDYALLCRYLVRETDVTKYTSVRTRAFGTGRPAGPVAMTNHNRLLGKVEGINGLKTGFTNSAGFCLSASAERDGRQIITVVMGGTDSKSRDLKAAELIERGFSALPPFTAAPKKTTPLPVATPTDNGPIPTIKTDRTPVTPPEQSSTKQEPMLIFRVTPPAPKKP